MLKPLCCVAERDTHEARFETPNFNYFCSLNVYWPHSSTFHLSKKIFNP